MQSQRFFIGNLPPNTSENELHKALQHYGTITNVELKKKENLVDPENVKVLAFVTLNLYDGDVESCLRKINSKPINGQYVNVSVAKESFLERLKREREENASHKSGSSGYIPASPIIQPSNKSKKFAETEENGDAEISENDNLILITKKRAANSMQNGKIVIESTNNTPVHVIGKPKDVKHLSEKSFDADKKRKESVNKKKNQYQLQKSLIQKSLSAVDTVKTKKIIFSDDDEVGQRKTSNVKSLFQDDVDQEENSFANDFSIKSEYEGPHGAALMKLQANMNLDPRFKIDHKFVEKVEDEEIVEDKNNERDWQYEILGQLVGSRVSNPSQPKDKEKKKLKMLRYDPSKANQDEFLVKRKEIQPMEVDDENALISVEKREVSKEVFYMVSDNLANSLKTRGDGFSLLSMFGNNDDEKEKLTNGLSKEKILISKNDKSAALNPFTYDSSESENEQVGHLQKPKKKMNVNNEQNQNSIEPKNKLFVESFFIAKNDVRLKEGKMFFRCNEGTEKAENYDEIKDKLKAIINTKINKSKRQLKGRIKKKSMRNR